MNKEWFKKKGLDKWFQRDNLIVLVLSGILLFIIALPIEEKENTTTIQTEPGLEQTGQGITADSTSPVFGGDEFDYATYLEERLEYMLSSVAGVGKVSVMVTMQSSEELVLEKDQPVSRSDIQETDSAGGSRITTQMENRETTIYSTDGTVSEPYVVKRLLPEIEGVLVVAQGAGDGRVNKSITEVVQALFDVEAHKIKVVKMEVSK